MLYFCMTLAIHQEAGNQPPATKEQVGYVIMNRMTSSSFPETCEEVVLQKAQFSWVQTYRLKDEHDIFNRYIYWLDDIGYNAIKLRAFASSQKAAQDVLDGVAVNLIGNSVNFVTSGFSNYWTGSYTRQKIYGLDFLHKK